MAQIRVEAATRRRAKTRVRFGFDRIAALLNRPSRVKVRYKRLIQQQDFGRWDMESTAFAIGFSIRPRDY